LTAHNIPWKTIIAGLTIAPLGEELIFRKIPLSLVEGTELFEKKKWYIVALIGVVFGWIHGGYYNVWIQGVAGFFIGWVYIKNGMSYWSSVITHFLYNFMIYIVFPVII
jgi:membrane protease YdiL (CAAX protease family)